MVKPFITHLLPLYSSVSTDNGIITSVIKKSIHLYRFVISKWISLCFKLCSKSIRLYSEFSLISKSNSVQSNLSAP